METDTFQHYRILRREDGTLWELGRGAMAVTYKAHDVNLDCPVALKVVNVHSLEDEHTRARFVREARAAAALRHRHIASVYHLGQDEQSYFYAMEFVNGETVEDLVARRGLLPSAEALAIAAQVARALGAAAKQGLVHRDIKPANLMVAREDEDGDGTLLVKVIDFGPARRAKTEGTARITRSGFVGTPHFASPEQVEERELDVRSDIYSLGVKLWFTLTGRPTFGGPAARAGARHLHDAPPWAVVAHLPAPVRALLARLLQKNPADRPQDPAALRREIEGCLAALAGGTAAADTPPAPAAVAPLPAADPAEAETVAPAAPLPVPEGAPPAVGDVLSERFTLLAVAGEGRGGRVFRAADACHGGCTAAVKVLRPGAGLDRAALATLRDDFRRLRAAPHPRLVEATTLDEARGHWYVAEEWVGGLTLVDLLRHRGNLDLPEALPLLAQVSDAAAHGTANALRHLELAPHQIFVVLAHAFGAERTRTILDRPVAKWPRFSLKIEALGTPRGQSGCPPTQDGLRTLVPDQAVHAGSPPSPEDGYFHPLGVLLYELLGGTPSPAETGGRREVPPLPVLNEKANELLQRTLSPQPGFRDERAFFDALLAACHLDARICAWTPRHPPPRHPRPRCRWLPPSARSSSAPQPPPAATCPPPAVPDGSVGWSSSWRQRSSRPL